MTLKDDRKLRDMGTMTAGKTTSKIEAGSKFAIHGHPITIITTDNEDTVVVYENGANRIFNTADLNGYLDLGTFPSGTYLTRPAAGIMEIARIVAVTGNCCYQLEITTGYVNSISATFTYAEFIEWHMSGAINASEIPLPAGASLYTPKHTAAAEPTPEALQFGEARIADLSAKLEKANKTLHEDSISYNIKLNDLQRQVANQRESIAEQVEKHTKELAAKDAEIASLKAKASLLASPVKEYLVKIGIYQSELNMLAREDGWQIQHLQFTAGDDLNAVLVRDLPTPQPRVTLTATAAAIYGEPAPASVTVPRPPVQAPPPVPQPALNQVIVGLDDKPASRPLTNNGTRNGETRPIPELRQKFEKEREQGNAEIAAIFAKTSDNLEALRREAVSRPSFLQGVQSS